MSVWIPEQLLMSVIQSLFWTMQAKTTKLKCGLLCQRGGDNSHHCELKEKPSMHS